MIFTSSYKPAGTKTGRLASSKFLGEFGANGQNQADEVRRLFIPRPGNKFIQNDLEGAEAVAVALLAREGNFRELVRRKVKIHNFVCLKIFPEKFEKWFTKSQIEALMPQSFHEHPSYKEIIKHCKSLHTEYDLAKRTVHGCLTGDHEVLTKDGWKNIAEIVNKRADEIAIYCPGDNRMRFEKPTEYIFYPSYAGQLHTLKNAYGTVDITVTDQHRMPYVTNNYLKITTPAKLPRGAGLPYACDPLLAAIDPVAVAKIRLLCAYHADGHKLPSGRIIFHFQKERKAGRLYQLLAAIGSTPRRRVLNSDLSYSIELDNELSDEITANGKPITWAAISWPAEWMRIYVEECQYWDGYVSDNQECFLTTNPQQAEVVHTMARLCGVGSSWNTQERDFTRQDIHRVGFSGRTKASYNSCSHTYQDCQSIPVYCFTVSTGLFFVRRNRSIMITGNSNYSMGWKTFQENILKETEGAVVLSAAECKRLLNAYFEIFPEIRIFQAEADKAAQEFLHLQNLFGWEIKVVQRYTTALGRTCVSWRPQSTVGVAGIVGGIRLQHYIERENKRWNVLTITHDSNLSEAPAEESLECANVSADCLSFEFTSPIDGWKCKIGVEKSSGDNWGKYDEAENPFGLKVIQ